MTTIMSSSSVLTTNLSGKRSRSKVGINSEDETNASKRLKPDCCPLNDLNNMNKSRIYNFGYRKKPAELFRKDLISAMKMADTEQLNREDYLPITDSWREEWEKGVQVAVNPEHLPEPVVKVLRQCLTSEQPFKLPKKLIKSRPESEPNSSDYELDLEDICWLEAMSECDNTPQISDNQLEESITQLEHQCARNIKARQVGIEYDDHIICDVCRSPDGEEGNEMVFCDLCNICVHQACYGITDIPEGDWLCRPCKEFGCQKNISCVLCPNFGGALKPTSSGNQWAHVSCALWVPEVSIGCVSTMEPITKIKQIPQTRWNLVCSLCNVKQGTPIQCSVKTCKIAYHVICAFNHKLKMKAIVESDKTKGVKLKSYCKKHTEKGDIDDDGNIEIKNESTESCSQSKTQHEIEIATSIPEEEDKHLNDFWKYIDIYKVQQELVRLNSSYAQNKNFHFVDFIVQYWKLKRTSNYGVSLIKLTSSAQFQEQQQQQRNEILRLRVDLERIRNLSYMICRREKVKRNWLSSHQSTVEQTLNCFTGVNTSDTQSKSTQLTDDSTKLVCDIISNSVIYNMDETEHKNRTNCIVRQLRKLSKCEPTQKRKPNPYAKFYITHVKRKQENDSQPVQQTVNGLPQNVFNSSANNSSINGVINKSKTDKPINGLTSPKHQIKYNSVPVNGLHNNSESSSVAVSSPDNKSGLNYRQSPRSLLKPKLMSPSNVINSNKELAQKPFTTLVPVLTRSNLSGYKIPKKKQELNQDSQPLAKLSLEIDEKIEKFKRRLDPELYSDRSPEKSPTKMTFNQTTQLYESSQDFNFFNKNNSHSQRGQYLTRGKNNGYYNRNNNNSLLRSRGPHNTEEAALMASARNDIDMRRHQSSGFRHSLIH